MKQKYESKAKEIHGPAKELKKAMQCKDLKALLRGNAGAFTFDYWFINEFINNLSIIRSESFRDPIDSYPRRKRNIFTHLSKNLGQIKDFAKAVTRNKKHAPADLLFVSRSRKARIKTNFGYKEGDYVFFGVIEEVKKRHPELSYTIYSIDDAYQKYEYATALDIFKSIISAVQKSLLWNIRKDKILNRFAEHGCERIGRFVTMFFSFRPFLRNMLFGYCIKSLLSSCDPRVIISNDDCLYTSPLVQKDIKMVVLQSASIVEYVEDYRSLIFQDKRMQPDIFLCSGVESAEIKKNASAAKSVLVTGQPRYDIIFNMQELYCKNDFKKRYGIGPEQRIVLWATQTHGLGQEENCRNLEAVFEAFQNLENVTLIIKQHPAETDAHTDLIKKFLDLYNVDAILTDKDSDTYEQLFVCDLMITKHSTTALEAVAMNKPVIILNLSNKPDIVDYAKEKVATGVYEKENLRKTIERLLRDDEEQRNNRDAYLNRHLFKIDGKATERVVDLIDHMIGY